MRRGFQPPNQHIFRLWPDAPGNMDSTIIFPYFFPPRPPNELIGISASLIIAIFHPV